jgi:hypothetical protein
VFGMGVGELRKMLGVQCRLVKIGKLLVACLEKSMKTLVYWKSLKAIFARTS